MLRFHGTIPAIAFAALITFSLAACSDESDAEESAPPAAAEEEADAGYDVDQAIPSVESIDVAAAESASPPRIHVESSRQRGIIPEREPFAADAFLDTEMAERLVSGTDLEVVPIAGQGSSPTHNSVRYAPAGADDDVFGIGIQVWDLSESDLTTAQRLAELRDQFLNVSDADHDEAPQGSFTSRRSGIRNFVFAADDEPLIFVLSCDVDHCHEWDDLFELGAEIAAGDS